jgi:hypothetical protein
MKAYLQGLESLVVLLHLKWSDRTYRHKEFSKAYKILYPPPGNDGICYLSEIIDSAQEAFPFLWVNSEKYTFPDAILKGGKALLLDFNSVRRNILAFVTEVRDRKIQTTADLDQMKRHLELNLELFDRQWCSYEQAYIT